MIPTSSFLTVLVQRVGSSHKYFDWFCSLYRMVFWDLSLVQHMKLDIDDDVVVFDAPDRIGILLLNVYVYQIFFEFFFVLGVRFLFLIYFLYYMQINKVSFTLMLQTIFLSTNSFQSNQNLSKVFDKWMAAHLGNTLSR